jgi:hypothetical protein
VPTALRHELQGCDGFRVESASGVLGRIEETWLGPTREPAALLVRTPDGRRDLVLAEDVETVLPENRLVLVPPEGRVLELDQSDAADGREKPLWELVAVLYAALAVIVCLVMGLAFLASYLASGWVY